jgi:hypothetical protein
MDLIASPRVSPQTREVLLARLADDPHYAPIALTPDAFVTLRAVLARVLPQSPQEGDSEIDLAASLDKQLAGAKGDGWRYATLPGDLEAYRVGLALLDEAAVELGAADFVGLPSAAQDSLLESIAAGRRRSARFDLMRWFEDLRADATRIYISHPRTLARMGYSGIADDPGGFVQIGIGQREAWEPQPR